MIKWKKALLIVGCSLAVFGICNAIYNADVYGSHLEKEIAEERNTPLLHWLLMIVGGIMSIIRLILDLKQGEDAFQMEYLIPELAVFGLLLFLMMWETNARYIVNYIPMIYVAAVLGMAQAFAFAGKKLAKKEIK